MSIYPNLSAPPSLTAFVFAGGGSLGAIEVGMLRELLDHGVRLGCVIGASAGAINAAYFAGRPDGDGVAMLELLWCRIRRRDIMPLTMLGLLEMMLSRRSHLVDATPLRMLLEKNLSFARVEHPALPLHIVATDMQSGKEIILSSGRWWTPFSRALRFPVFSRRCALAGWIWSMAA
jgi:NTE family protein